eukprot:768348-Hanusia_phi.AAC.4
MQARQQAFAAMMCVLWCQEARECSIDNRQDDDEDELDDVYEGDSLFLTPCPLASSVPESLSQGGEGHAVQDMYESVLPTQCVLCHEEASAGRPVGLISFVLVQSLSSRVLPRLPFPSFPSSSSQSLLRSCDHAPLNVAKGCFLPSSSHLLPRCLIVLSSLLLLTYMYLPAPTAVGWSDPYSQASSVLSTLSKSDRRIEGTPRAEEVHASTSDDSPPPPPGRAKDHPWSFTHVSQRGWEQLGRECGVATTFCGHAVHRDCLNR